MCNQIFRCLALFFLMLMQSAMAQVSNYNPFFVGSSSGNIYRMDQGLLTLPVVSVLPTVDNAQEQLLNVVLKHSGGNSFELISVDELSPEQECTRAEVSEAIPHLTLDMTVAEAEQLIGCTANLQLGSVDLDTGRQVLARWTGNDGVSNSPPGSGSSYIGSSSSVWISGSETGVFQTGLTSSSGSPSITFVLRENALQSISYSDLNQFRFCYAEDLLTGFRKINLNDDYSSLISVLGCEGNLHGTTFDESNVQHEYSWQLPPGPQTGIPNYNGLSTVLSESIQVTMLNSGVQSLRFNSAKRFVSENPCSVEDLVAARDQVQVGQNALDVSSLLDCGVRSESLSSDGLSESVSYRWQTSIPNDSLFVSLNRMLQVQLVDGVVAYVRLDRF